MDADFLSMLETGVDLPLMFREELKYFRVKILGLIQEDMARVIGISYTSYKRIESGSRYGIGVFTCLIKYLQDNNKAGLLKILLLSHGVDILGLERLFWVRFPNGDYPPNGVPVPVVGLCDGEKVMGIGRYWKNSGGGWWESSVMDIYAWMDVRPPPLPGKDGE
jgi:DNA-binding XRE family transcriptional regulator